MQVNDSTPALEYIQTESQVKIFSAVIGYDDLTVSLGEDSTSPAVLQKGHSWMLTCKRYLHGEDSAIGSVIDATRAPVTDSNEIDTKFNLDIHCCDPDDEEVSLGCVKGFEQKWHFV